MISAIFEFEYPPVLADHSLEEKTEESEPCKEARHSETSVRHQCDIALQTNKHR